MNCIKNERIKNEIIKNERIKNECIKNELIKKRTDPPKINLNLLPKYDTATNPICDIRHNWRQTSKCDKCHTVRRQTSYCDKCHIATHVITSNVIR